MTVPWRRWTLRTRLLVIGLLGLAVTQAVGGIVLYTALSVAGVHAVDASAAATAAEVRALVLSDRLPATLPVTGAEIVQVLDGRGRVVSASTNADRLTPILVADERRRALRDPVTVPGSRLGLTSRLRVRVTSAEGGATADAGTVVLVAEPVDDLTRSEDLLQTVLLISFPVVLAVLGLIAWRVIGAALRPVEELRSAAERISGSGRDETLPVPVSDDEIHALATTLNSMLARLAGARERERDLVADVTHELRSPLASMRLQLDVAGRRGEGGGVLADLDAEVMRMSGLVDDLLVLARLDSDREPGVAPVAVPVRPHLATVAAAYAGAQPPVEVLPGPDPVLLGRDDELVRVLANLVDNARRHARSGVRVSALERAGRVIVRVDDDGPGIPEADRDRVFDRFARLDDSRDRDAGGAGLGLAIVRGLVLSRGGEVRLAVSPAGGLRVEVELPAAPATLRR